MNTLWPTRRRENLAKVRLPLYRSLQHTQPWMTSLDCADPSMRVDKRNESLSALQALALLNNGFMLSQSKHFAHRVAQTSSALADQVFAAYLLALGSEPDETTHRNWSRLQVKWLALPYLCRLLFNLNAFTFID